MKATKSSILCTGPVDLSALSEKETKNTEIDTINFTSVTTTLSENAQQAIGRIINERAIVVFTSSNAVVSVMNFLGHKRPDWTIFCLENSTYEQARKYFGAGSIRQTASNAAMLADRIIEEKKIKELTFFCGSRRMDDLPGILAQNKITVNEVVVYETTLIPEKINAEYDAILFFSPGAAESFFNDNSLPSKTTLFAIGKTTSDKLKTLSKNPVITADMPDKLGLVRKAIQHLSVKGA